jgi:hypothetical protein
MLLHYVTGALRKMGDQQDIIQVIPRNLRREMPNAARSMRVFSL